MITKEHAKAVLEKSLPALQEKHGVASLALFGSLVRDEARDDSDVDILVEFEPGRVPGMLGFVRLQRELAELLGVETVDLVMKRALVPELRPHILREAVHVEA